MRVPKLSAKDLKRLQDLWARIIDPASAGEQTARLPHPYTLHGILQRRDVPIRHPKRSVGVTAEQRAADADRRHGRPHMLTQGVFPSAIRGGMSLLLRTKRAKAGAAVSSKGMR